MQKSYTFGLNAEELNDTSAGDFREVRNTAGGTENHNPFGQGYFNDPSQMALTPDNAKVTSIPSPYARMHITDIAFRELMAGVGVMDASAIKDHINNMSGDYLRAMSHCLDVYEMMYHFNELDLIDKGISIKRVELVSKRDGRYQDLLSRNKNLSSFIDTLDLFRHRYLQDIKKRNVSAYKFDFTQIYIFKYNGHTFAATSPFTGFFAKADCNLSKAELSVVWEANGYKHTHKLFTDTPKEWLGIKDRDPKFLEFLYLLLKGDLGEIFRHLFNAVKACIPDIKALDDDTFEKRYPEFNFGSDVLPQIAGNTQNVSYIRPDGLDCSYLKYLLYLRQPVDLAISEEAYNKEIKDRVFPEGTENKVPWIGVNDFLSDALVVLPYDINDNYYAATYIDENNNPHRRCLLPLKRQALDYLDINSSSCLVACSCQSLAAHILVAGSLAWSISSRSFVLTHYAPTHIARILSESCEEILACQEPAQSRLIAVLVLGHIIEAERRSSEVGLLIHTELEYGLTGKRLLPRIHPLDV